MMTDAHGSMLRSGSNDAVSIPGGLICYIGMLSTCPARNNQPSFSSDRITCLGMTEPDSSLCLVRHFQRCGSDPTQHQSLTLA